jgi:eukaryotic-like serine/threonine-protein kinase
MLNQLLDRRYQVIETLGSGGFGQTYIAEDTKLPGRPRCVVKHLKPSSNDPFTLQVARRLFESEAQTLQQLGNHNQIPQLLAFFEENQEFFLVQQLIEGHPISNELSPGKQLSESYVIALFQNILEPLAFVHQSNVIHRDLKPANLIRRKQDGKVVLIDFGAVKEIAATQVTSTGKSQLTVGIGTHGYMPSEQSRGVPRLSSDVYAVGMIGIEALTGVIAHEIPEDAQTGELIWRNGINVSPMLGDIIDKMVRYDFRQRYKSAQEVLEALPSVNSIPNPPTTSPTIPPTLVPTAVSSIYELALEYVEAGQSKRVVFAENQRTRTPGSFRLGRDPATCDLVLSDTSVSRLQAEIFFDAQQQRFFLRSLNQNNPPIVNGGKLPMGEVFLTQGSTVRLGNIDLTVASVTQRQHLGGSVPTPPIPPPVEIPSQPLPVTEPPENHEELQFAPPPVPTEYRQEVPNPVAVEASGGQVAPLEVGEGEWTKEEKRFNRELVLLTIGGFAVRLFQECVVECSCRYILPQFQKWIFT